MLCFVVSSFLMFDAIDDHIVEAYFSIGLVTALYVVISFKLQIVSANLVSAKMLHLE